MKILASWMKKIAKICKEAGTEDNLPKYSAELETIKKEVKELALKFPVPSI
jgi:hypothetical protein